MEGSEMRRQHNPILLLVCCLPLGCMSAHPIAVSTGSPARDLSAEPLATAGFSFHDPDERRTAGFDDQRAGQMIADTHPGSLVDVSNLDGRYQGTLLSGGASGVQLMNCIGKEVVPGPEGQRQLKTSHVPFQTFKIASLTSFSVIAPPKPDFAPPDLSQETKGLAVADIVYQDGTRQRRGELIETSQ